MRLFLIHGGLASSMLFFAIIAGVWGLVAYLRRRGVEGDYWGILAVGELLFLAQTVVGVAMWVGGARPPRSVHLLYGAVASITLPTYFALSKGRDDRMASLIYGLLCFFLVGISLRAMSTGMP